MNEYRCIGEAVRAGYKEWARAIAAKRPAVRLWTETNGQITQVFTAQRIDRTRFKILYQRAAAMC
jgi:hypothetical protein